MQIEIEINNSSKSPIKNSFLESVIRKTLLREEFSYLEKKKLAISVALILPQEIKSLNRRYRKKNSVTDVLSFAEFKSQKKLKETIEKDILLGEIILCYNDIIEYAKKKRIEKNIELARVMSHGLLHLLGLRHGKKMFAIQNEVANSIK